MQSVLASELHVRHVAGGHTGMCCLPAANPHPSVKLCIFIGMFIGGYAGWWLGEYVGILTAYIASGVGSVLGVYAGWRFARAFLS